MKILRKIIEIDESLCDGCGQCVPACEEGAIEIVNGKARLVAEKYCDGLGACLGNCPTGALKITEREAEDFDEAAVEAYLASKKDRTTGTKSSGTCPSAMVKNLQPVSCEDANRPAFNQSAASMLGHWPIQIRLIPPEAPFLKNAHLLVTADCAAVAYPDFHQRLVSGKAVMLGCPKFDDQQGYVKKFTDIFNKANISSITCVIMEVPCCSTMLGILDAALKASGKDIAIQKYIISPNGKIVKGGD